MRLLAVASLLFLAAAGPVAAQGSVNVYNWSDYIAEDQVKDFARDTGIKVNYTTYDSNEILDAKLRTGRSGYDIVVPTASPFFVRQLQANIFLPLDRAKLKNWKNLDPEIMTALAKYDPNNAHAVPWMWGTTGIGYNVAKVKEIMPDAPLDSWAIIFKPEILEKFKDCGVQLLDSPDDIFPAALAYLGLPPDSKEQGDLDKAAELIKAIVPYLQKFHSSEYINGLANGDLCIAVGYSGDILQARDRATEAANGVEVGYSIPKEGALMWLDSFAVLADAPHPEEAFAFINFMLDPEIAARNSNYLYYANGNKDSQKFLQEDVLGDPAIYPPKETFDKLFTTTPNDFRVQRVVTRLWSSITTGG